MGIICFQTQNYWIAELYLRLRKPRVVLLRAFSSKFITVLGVDLFQFVFLRCICLFVGCCTFQSHIKTSFVSIAAPWSPFSASVLWVLSQKVVRKFIVLDFYSGFVSSIFSWLKREGSRAVCKIRIRCRLSPSYGSLVSTNNMSIVTRTNGL